MAPATPRVGTRSLGRTGLTVSEIGFGGWGIGGLTRGATSYGPTDDAESLRALARALECGITFFDTSDLYGYGHSEELIGRAVGSRRAHVVLASKVGFLEHHGPQDFSPQHLRSSLRGSLRRLGTTYLDLYQLHSPPREVLAPGSAALETLRQLQAEGMIRAFGASVRAPEDGLLAVQDADLAVIQVNFNLADQRAVDNGLLALCQQRGVGVIARTPLAFGLLSGAHVPDQGFAPDHHLSTWSSQQVARWAGAADYFADAFTGPAGQTPAQRALRYCLSYPAVSSVIPGMLRAAEVEENVQASTLGPLSAAELARVEQRYHLQSFFLGSPRREQAGDAFAGR